MQLSKKIVELTRDIGFDLSGISRADPSHYAALVRQWVDDKRHGGMSWYEKNIDRRVDPAKHLFGKARSIITVGLYYRPLEIPAELAQDKSRGLIARYAQYDDYHGVIEKLLKRLAHSIEKEIGKTFVYHCYVDTGPVLEREAGMRAGLGFIGKNTTLINPTLGSYFFLGEIISNLDLEPVSFGGSSRGTCGACNRCQVTCPTGALLAPWQLDARKCISYLTIENKGAIPIALRPLIGNRIYGCDICQEVCPWNKSAVSALPSPLLNFRPELVAPRLLDLLVLNEQKFKEMFRGTPVLRAKWRGFLRNVLVAVGNWGSHLTLPYLRPWLKDDDDLIREHAFWAQQHLSKD